MPKPIPGFPYIVLPGDTLIGIAKRAYGRAAKWRDIWKANQSTLRSGDPNVIFPTEVLVIPPDDLEVAAVEDLLALFLPSLSNKEPEDFTVIVNGIEIPMSSGRVFRTMDTGADGWSSKKTWNPENKDLKEQNDVLKPYLYPKAQVYLGKLLAIEGILYTPTPQIKKNIRSISLEGFSYTADIVDSTVRPPYQEDKVTLQARIEGLVAPHGLKLAYDPLELELDPSVILEIFDRVTVGAEEKVFAHCSKLATQRGFLMSSNELGQPVLVRANTKGKPVGTIKEEFPPGERWEARFDGRARFNVYKAIAQTPKKNSQTAVAKDDAVPKSRFLTFKAPDTTTGNIQQAADWRRSKQLADALTIPWPVSSWYAPDGTRWKENTLVTVESETIFVPDGFTFLIRTVEYVFDSNGTRATLGLVPPQVYTGESLIEPWLEASLF